jgi:hypothetical protein
MKGDIVFVRFPYTDLSITKTRPGLVRHEERDEVVLAYISSRVPILPSDTRLTPSWLHATDSDPY